MRRSHRSGGPNLGCTSRREVGLLRSLAMCLTVALVWRGGAVHVSAQPRTEIFYATGTKSLLIGENNLKQRLSLSCRLTTKRDAIRGSAPS